MAIGGHITGSGVIESVIGASVQRGRDRTAEVAVRRAKRELEEEAFKLNRAGSTIATLRNNLKTKDENFGNISLTTISN
ncbi:hypothetical protein SPBRAN_670 [uncultured Candidatus Thioglobus sp.]|nr:hypothetical protein SPBRAN_670 [uncultured Candidatus Thioglobus sp.]